MTRNRGWITRLSLITVALFLAMTLASYASTVTGLAVKKAENTVEIHLRASGPVYYRVLSTSKPRNALVVEMPNSSVLDNAMKTVQIDKGIVERAKVRRVGGKARLVVEVLHPVKYLIKAAPGNRGFILTVGTQTIAAKVTKAAPKMAAGEPSMECPEPVKPPKSNMAPKAYKTAYKHKDMRPKRKRVYVKPVKLVSIDFVNADLIYVLKLLAKELDVNLVTDDTVTGSVTMSLKNVSAQTAMNIIIKMNGFKQKKLGNILFVGSEETMNAITPDVITYHPTGDVRLKVYRLENIGASDAVSTIKASFPLVEAKPAPNENAVIVNANSAMLAEIDTLIQGVDIPKPDTDVAPGPREKVEVVRLKYAKAEDAMGLLKTLLGSDAPATMEIDKRLNAVVFKGYETQIDKAKAQLEDIDIPLQQVMISVKVVDLSETGGKSLGIDWQVGAEDGTQPIQWYEVPNGYPATSGTAYNPYSDGPSAYADSPIGFFVRDPFVLRSAISMAITKGEAKVLASPRVAALDGEKATIHIGDKYPIVYYDPRAGQYQVIYVDIGIKLDVTPKISPDGYISTKINTTVSDLRELINNQYPRTTERTAELTIRVKDNNTIVIGGMVQESSRQNVKKVPLLGDIPVLGQLFRQTTSDRAKGEVVIMITPKIITQ